MPRRAFMTAFVLLDSVVLLGQLWPEAAPPFARIVNIVFLAASLIYFSLALLRPTGARQPGNNS